MNELELRGEIVIPGEEIGKNVRRGDFTYAVGPDVKAGVFGIKEDKENMVSVIPLSGKYIPKEGDMVVGVVSNVNRNGWAISINSPYETYLAREKRRDDDDTFDLRRLYKEGDIVSIMVSSVDEVKNSYAEGPRKLVGGRIAMLNAKKIPRVIGSKKSMLSLLRDKSGCRIVVGQNGIIWIDGPEKNMEVVVEAILKIGKESHTKGLTNRISIFVDEEMARRGAVAPPPLPRDERDEGYERPRSEGRYRDRGSSRGSDRPHGSDRPRGRDYSRDRRGPRRDSPRGEGQRSNEGSGGEGRRDESPQAKESPQGGEQNGNQDQNKF